MQVDEYLRGKPRAPKLPWTLDLHFDVHSRIGETFQLYCEVLELTRELNAWVRSRPVNIHPSLQPRLQLSHLRLAVAA
jgi:hypothetical protein